MTELTDADLARIERAFRECQADHGTCKHEIAGYQLVQDVGPKLIHEVRRLRGLISEAPTLDGGAASRRLAEEFRKREGQKRGGGGEKKGGR
jgi:hypothetical protein